MPTHSTNTPDPRDVYVLPPQVIECLVSKDNIWVSSGGCNACGGEFRRSTYFDICFIPRHRARPPYYDAVGVMACSRECAEQLAQNPPVPHSTLPTAGSPSAPSHSNRGWIYAFREIGNYPDDTERSGKWMVFWKPEEVDDSWNRVRESLRIGRLGYVAKVATRPRQWPKGLYYVVCVYTYDSDDLDDVHRVREELRRLGVTWKIGYKEDRETAQGHYSSRGKPVSKYWE